MLWGYHSKNYGWRTNLDRFGFDSEFLFDANLNARFPERMDCGIQFRQFD